MTDDEATAALAKEAGIEVRWRDARGAAQTVGLDTMRAVLAALDLPAASRREIEASRARLRQERAQTQPLIVARGGQAVAFDGGKTAEIEAENGARGSVPLRNTANGRTAFPAPRAAGYYRVESGGRQMVLAVAPPRALLPGAIAKGRPAGVSVQIYSLRGGTSGGFGDFAALGAFARNAGRAGFDAVMASPVHALFGAEPWRFSPYSPSTRLFLNPLFADATLAGGTKLKDSRLDSSLIDWKTAGPEKQRALEHAFAQFRRAAAPKQFEDFCREGGARLLAHALFEALDARFRRQGLHGFRNWPSGFDSPAAAGVLDFARQCRRDVAYQLFLQWLAARSAESAQKKARATMAIGIIADLAVGMDPQGSHAWTAPQELLRGLHVGAPPDIFNTQGQDWGLTSLSPRALHRLRYTPFIATLRAAMRHAGGVRIDHALGLRRLWAVPEGASPKDGAYLRFPENDMLGLIALESHRNRAVVLGEDLGTVPEGFRAELAQAGVLGMQVLWFERNAKEFARPSAWRREAMATTTTHDLPTVAGWWTERDIQWRKRLGQLRDTEDDERNGRARDRARLWTALQTARCTKGDMPSPDDCEPAVEGALAYIGRTRSAIAFAPVEDLLADPEQPNLPGTVDEHPNWRRRMMTADPLRDRTVRKRIKTFLAARGKT